MENYKLKLILASASPRRKELLGHLKVPFEIKTLNVPEESSSPDPVTFSLEIAKLKGEAVFATYPTENVFVVSADTIVNLGKKIFGKPADRAEAKSILLELAGKTHSVFTAVNVKVRVHGKVKEFSFVDETKVTFETISPYLLEKYLDSGDSLDKAGAYGIQNGSLTFISNVNGDYANVVGFPLSRFIKETEAFFKREFTEGRSWFDYF